MIPSLTTLPATTGSLTPLTAEDRRRLRRFPFLSRAGEATVDALLGKSSVSVTPKNRLVVRESLAATALLVIVTGRVALLSRLPGERSVVIATVGPGSVIMPAAAFRAGGYDLTAQAIEETRIVAVPLQLVREAAETDRELSAALLGLLADASHDLLARLTDFRLRSAPQRFAAYLVSAARTAGWPGTGEFAMKLTEDRKTLASLLGMTPENLSRIIALFRARGVTVTGREVAIADLAALASFAGLALG